MTAPLAGIKVVELARILAGPWAGQTLADLGAEVIKVEAPEGDDTRRWGPPFIDRDGDRSAAYFHATNRGKKSVTCDFRTPEGQDYVRSLVAEARPKPSSKGIPEFVVHMLDGVDAQSVDAEVAEVKVVDGDKLIDELAKGRPMERILRTVAA